MLTNKAKADLKSIAIYTQNKWGRDQRTTYLRQLDDTFYMLSETPELGSKCDFIKPGYRKLPIFSHLVFYHSLVNLKLSLFVYYRNVWMLKNRLKAYNIV